MIVHIPGSPDGVGDPLKALARLNSSSCSQAQHLLSEKWPKMEISSKARLQFTFFLPASASVDFLSIAAMPTMQLGTCAPQQRFSVMVTGPAASSLTVRTATSPCTAPCVWSWPRMGSNRCTPDHQAQCTPSHPHTLTITTVPAPTKQAIPHRHI